MTCSWRSLRTLVPGVPFLLLTLVLAGCLPPVPGPVADDRAAPETAQAGQLTQPRDGYLFCFWNCENLFDDQVDDYTHTPDKEFDLWFGRNPKALQQKLDNLSRVLVSLDGGRGPDILAVAELESERAAELLRDALNKRLGNHTELHYQHVLMKEVKVGRHIATAILTRLPVAKEPPRLLGRSLRILEGHLDVNGHDLTVIASHWTSRISDAGDEEGKGRFKYADTIYGRFQELYEQDHDVDFLVCGDFNDTPSDDSVTENLHATDNRRLLRQSKGEPHLFDLFMGKEPEKFGTHYHRGHWYIFDQIVVSPAMLKDKGWTCDPDSARTVRDLTADEKGRPWDFGREKDDVELSDRGFSDHFPVTVRLKVKEN